MNSQRIRERDAGLVQEYAIKAEQYDTRRNIEVARQMEDWFYEKHLMDWRDCLPKQERGKGR